MVTVYPTSYSDSKYQRKVAIGHEEFQPTYGECVTTFAKIGS